VPIKKAEKKGDPLANEEPADQKGLWRCPILDDGEVGEKKSARGKVRLRIPKFHRVSENEGGGIERGDYAIGTKQKRGDSEKGSRNFLKRGSEGGGEGFGHVGKKKKGN